MANPPLNQPEIIQRVSQPKDGNGSTTPLVPALTSLARTYDTTISTSTEITLNASATFIEVTALNQPIFMNWGTSDASSSAWSHVIPAGMTRQWFIPVDTTTGSLFTAVNFIEQAPSATLCVSEF